MTKIPKNPNQKLNGTGVSVMGLLVVLLALPFTTYFIISLTDISGTQSSYQQFDNGLLTGLNHQPPHYEMLSGGNTQDIYCVETDANIYNGLPSSNVEVDRAGLGGTYGNDSLSGTWVDCDTLTNLPQVYASEEWNVGTPCGNYQTVTDNLANGSYECGDDGYAFAYSDPNFNYSSQTISQMKFEWLARGITHACANETLGVPMTGYVSLDYTISIQVSSYYNLFGLNLSGMTGYQVEEYHHEIIKGTTTSYNAFQDDVSGQCIPYYSILTDLTFDERTAIQRNVGWDEYYGDYHNEPPVITFIVDIDNLRDVELDKPLSLSHKIMPFQTQHTTHCCNLLSRFSFVTTTSDFTGFLTNAVMGGLGVVFWGLALASTPAWNPVVSWSKGRVK